VGFTQIGGRELQVAVTQAVIQVAMQVAIQVAIEWDMREVMISVEVVVIPVVIPVVIQVVIPVDLPVDLPVLCQAADFRGTLGGLVPVVGIRQPLVAEEEVMPVVAVAEAIGAGLPLLYGTGIAVVQMQLLKSECLIESMRK